MRAMSRWSGRVYFKEKKMQVLEHNFKQLGLMPDAKVEHVKEDDYLFLTTIHDSCYTIYIHWHNRDESRQPVIQVKLWPRKFKDMARANVPIYLITQWSFNAHILSNGEGIGRLALLRNKCLSNDGGFLGYLGDDGNVYQKLSLSLFTLKSARTFARGFYGHVREEGQDLIELVIECYRQEGMEIME